MVRNQSSKVLLVLVVLVAAWQYTNTWTYQILELSGPIVFGLNKRPFVYRALVPLLARLLWMMGIPDHIAITVVVMLSAIGFLYALIYLFTFRQ